MVIRLENGSDNAPDHIEVHLLFQLGSFVPWTAVIQHSFGLVASIYYDSFNEISVLKRNEYLLKSTIAFNSNISTTEKRLFSLNCPLE